MYGFFKSLGSFFLRPIFATVLDKKPKGQIIQKTFPKKGIERVAGLGGYFNVSTPELTAIDLIRFIKKSGHLNNVATILRDLSKKWDGRKMSSLCLDPLVPTVSLQRLGYILECILDLEKEASYMARALEQRRPVPSVLSQSTKKKDEKMSDYQFNDRWKLYINTKVEPD